MTKDEALVLALEALEPLSVDAELRGDNFPEGNRIHKMADAGFKAIAAIKEALEAPVQEPAGHFLDFTYADSVGQVYVYDQFTKGQPFYTTLPAAPVQEPVGITTGCVSHPGFFTVVMRSLEAIPEGTNLYTNPLAAQRQWVGLTNEERRNCTQSPFTFENYLAIENKLKEKNNG